MTNDRVFDFLKNHLPHPNSIFEPIERGKGSSFSPLSHGRHGMGWVEDLVRRCIPGAEVFPPMTASRWYGNYFIEFDRWRTYCQFTDLTSYQGVLLKSPGGRASHWRIPNTDNISAWYGKEYEGSHVSLLCIDETFLTETCRLFYYGVVSGVRAGQSVDAWLDPLVLEKLAQKIRANNGALLTARQNFHEAAQSLEFFFGPTEENRALTEVCSVDEPSDKSREWVWSYCQGTLLHFLLGHEFGHYAFRQSEHPFFVQVRKFAAGFMATVPNPEGNLSEEVFCDIVALEHCLFQMIYFGIPPVFTVYGPILALTLSSCLIANRKPKTSTDESSIRGITFRLHAIAHYWARRHPLNEHQQFAAVARRASISITPLVKSIADTLSM